MRDTYPMADRTLYVADLDGTLLGERAVLSAFTAASLEQLIADGVLITCATARSWVTVQRVLGSFRFRLPMVLNNGTFTYDATTATLLDQHVLAEPVARTILELCCKHGVAPIVYGMDGTTEQASWMPNRPAGAMDRYWADRPSDPRASPRSGWANLPTNSIFTIAATGPSKSLASLSDDIRLSLAGATEVTVQQDANHPEDTWLEAVPSGVSKAAAIQNVLPLAGANRLVVFGDNLNDLPLFAIADECYAVANAASAVRDAATAIIESNTNDGVARWLTSRYIGARKNE
jgi:Cof subfamily protein (haloacid dehalogenase superfamily)